MKALTPTIYLTRNGLLEPLGQSQVFAYLRGLSRDHAITLITYEKPEDKADSSRMARARAECEQHGIRWLPQEFRPRPRIIAPAYSMVRMAWLVWREVRSRRAHLIHARSYVPAAGALLVSRLTGVPFIFDMRALWPEELITAGRLTRGSILHKVIVAIERACLKHSAAVVSLTHAAVGYLKSQYPTELKDQSIEVIPTCADLERFTLAKGKFERATVHGCIGTVLSGWFRTDWLAAWFAGVAQLDPEATFDIVTRDDAELVRKSVDPNGLLGHRLKIASRWPDEMPEAVSRHTVSVMFYAGGEVSELGRSPTRMAEILGSGIPVVANEGVGDVASIVRDNQVGAILRGPEPLQVEIALNELNILMTDDGLPRRCRETAEKLFSLEVGTKAYRSLYRAILQGESSSCAD